MKCIVVQIELATTGAEIYLRAKVRRDSFQARYGINAMNNNLHNLTAPPPGGG